MKPNVESACVVLMVAAASALARPEAVALQQAPTASVVIAAVTKNNRPVTDLTRSDLTVVIDNHIVPVSRVEPVTEPLTVAVCAHEVDASALESFVQVILGARRENKVSIVGPPPDFTSNVAILKARLSLWKRPPDVNYYASSLRPLLELAVALRPMSGRRAVVIFFDERSHENDGTEFGISRQGNSISEVSILDSLKAADARFWGVVHAADGAYEPTEAADQLRRQVFHDATVRSGGGWVDDGLDAKDSARAFQTVAEILVSEFKVTYQVPTSVSNRTPSYEIKTTRSGVRLLSPKW